MNGAWAGMAVACGMVAVAALLLPGPPAQLRFARLWPLRVGRGRPGWPRAVGPALAGGLGLLLAGPGGAVAACVAASALARRRRAGRAERFAADASTQLADAVGRIAEELRIGGHPAAVLAGCAADGQIAARLLGPAATAAGLGDDVPAVLRAGADAVPGIRTEIERLADAWALAERHGIPLATLLRRVAEDARWRLRFGHAVRAQLAGPRSTAAVLTALPLLGIGLGHLMGADPLDVLRSGVVGQLLLVTGVLLMAAGDAWSARILRSAVPR